MSHRKDTIRSDAKPRMAIKEYLERLYEWNSYPGKIHKGKMEVFVHGHWISLKEFNKYFPKPTAINFRQRGENIDSTTSWME